VKFSCLAAGKERVYLLFLELIMVKLVVLYPNPVDPEAFERYYTAEHLPLMRRLVGPDVPLPTYKTVQPAPYYRVAEIHFRDRTHFDEFVGSGKSRIGSESAKRVSTGGKPITFLCEEQPKI
jgi:uncharacterized protein (TIGR02118 family)